MFHYILLFSPTHSKVFEVQSVLLQIFFQPSIILEYIECYICEPVRIDLVNAKYKEEG
jgi:hypothetical protein